MNTRETYTHDFHWLLPTRYQVRFSIVFCWQQSRLPYLRATTKSCVLFLLKRPRFHDLQRAKSCLTSFNCLCSGFTLFSFEYLLATHTRKSLIGRHEKVSDVFSASAHEKKHHVFCVNTHHHARKLYNS